MMGSVSVNSKKVFLFVLLVLLFQAFVYAQNPNQGRNAVRERIKGRLNARNLEMKQLLIPADLPEEFCIDVEHEGLMKRLRLRKHSFRGPNFKVIAHQAGGIITELDPGPVRTYIGQVEGQEDTLVGGILSRRGGLQVSIHSHTRPTWHITPLQEDETDDVSHELSHSDQSFGRFHAVYEEEAIELPVVDESEFTSVNPDEPPMMPFGTSSSLANITNQVTAASTAVTGQTVEVWQAELGIEVTYNAYNERYGSNTQNVMDGMDLLISGSMGLWLRDCQVKHVLGVVSIRTDSASDPYSSYGNTSTEFLHKFRNVWNGNDSSPRPSSTHDLAALQHARGGGGLAWVGQIGTSYRYSMAGSNTNGGWRDGYIRHEIGHTWSLGHSPGRREIDRSGNQYGVMWVGNHDRFTTDESQYVINHRNSKTGYLDPVTISTIGPMGPYGVWDTVSASVGGTPIIIDVLANDRDTNNDDFYIESVGVIGGQTVRGTLEISSGTGPGGRDQVLYTPPATGTTGTDMFYYNLRDTTGQSGWGKVDIVLIPPVEVDLSTTIYGYDLGAYDSTVQFGWTLLHPGMSGDIYWSDTVNTADRGTDGGTNDINRDFVYSSNPVTLSHKVLNGLWAVTINMGDRDYPHDNMVVAAEGQVFHTDVDSAAGQYSYANFSVIVTDGWLDITMSDAGGSDVNWIWNRLSLRWEGPAGSKDLSDFAHLAAGWQLTNPDAGVILFEDYNAYDPGSLSGQGGWSDFLSAPSVTNTEIYPGGGNAIYATDTDTTYRFAKKAIPGSTDVTDETYYISTTFTVTQATNTDDDSILLALANSDNSQPKMEFRIRPHNGSIVVTGWGGYYSPAGLFNTQIGKNYRAIVKVSPDSSTTARIDAGVYEIADNQLMDESSYSWQINNYTFTLTDGQTTYPYVLSGIRSNEVQSDDLLISSTWSAIQQVVSAEDSIIFADTIFLDDYNPYDPGSLSGQGGWSDFLSTPSVTDTEVYPGGGNAIYATDTDNTYRFAKKAIDGSTDVTANTYYISATFTLAQATNHNDDSLLFAIAGVDNYQPKMEFRIRPHNGSIVITGWGGYYEPSGLFNAQVDKDYRAIVKVSPDSSTTARVDAGVYEIVDNQLMDESSYIWQISDYTFTLTDGQTNYPYALSGVRSNEVLGDDILISGTWSTIQAVVSGELKVVDWQEHIRSDYNLDGVIDMDDLILLLDFWLD